MNHPDNFILGEPAPKSFLALDQLLEVDPRILDEILSSTHFDYFTILKRSCATFDDPVMVDLFAEHPLRQLLDIGGDFLVR